MSLAATVVAAVSPVASIKFVGSRAEGRATVWSDWDFAVRTHDFEATAEALPGLLAPLEPLVQQWDRLSEQYCWMLILRGPEKVDLIFPDEPHEKKGPWVPGPDTVAAIDDHFWDWMLWLRGKEAAGKDEVVASELEKLHGHLLGPLDVETTPTSIAQAVESYLAARDRAERRFGRVISRDVEQAVVPSLRSPD